MGRLLGCVPPFRSSLVGLGRIWRSSHSLRARTRLSAFQSRDRIITVQLVSSAVPEHHRPGAIISFRYGAFESAILNRVILNLHRQPAIAAPIWKAFWHCPRFQHPLHLEAKIIMEM